MTRDGIYSSKNYLDVERDIKQTKKSLVKTPSSWRETSETLFFSRDSVFVM